jgi:hypothetical protein
MSKTVFDHLNEQIDEVVRGRRYIIAEIGKLKLSVDELKGALGASSSNDIGATVSDLKGFIGQAVNTLGDLKNTVSQLAASMGAMNKTVENAYNAIKNIKAGGGSGSSFGSSQQQAPSFGSSQPSSYGSSQQQAPSFGSSQPSSFGSSQPQAPSFGSSQPSSFGSSQPQAPSFAGLQPPAQAPSQPAGGSGGGKFDGILSAARSGTPSKDIGVMLDQIRASLASANPLNPVLFELSMEAGRLKSLGSKSLDGAAIGTLETKVNNWKAKSG